MPQSSGLTISIEVAFVDDANQQKIVSLNLKQGATVFTALQTARVPALLLGREDLEKRIGIFGKLVPLSRLLQEGDRVEIYQDLLVDPKEARRSKAKAQRASSNKR